VLRDEAALSYQFGANSYTHSVLSLAETVTVAIANILHVTWRSEQ
jgi:hypothetical protein